MQLVKCKNRRAVRIAVRERIFVKRVEELDDLVPRPVGDAVKRAAQLWPTLALQARARQTRKCVFWSCVLATTQVLARHHRPHTTIRFKVADHRSERILIARHP